MVDKDEEIVKVKIPTKYGKVEVEGSPEAMKYFVGVISGEKKGIKKFSIRQQIVKLIEKGFFNTPRTLSEIKSELEKMGYRYSSSSLFPVIFRYFIRTEKIKRIGERGSYQYFVETEK